MQRRSVVTAALCIAFPLIGAAQTSELPVRPILAEYSAALDRIVIASDNPPQLHVYHPLSNTLQSLDLSKRALSLRLSPSGRHAAVGHDRLLSWINLSTLSVDSTYAVPFPVDQADASDAWIWARGANSAGASVNVATGALVITNSAPSGDTRFVPRLSALVGTYGSKTFKVDVSGGPMGQVTDFPGQVVCNWIAVSENQRRLYSACSEAILTGASATDPTLYEMRLTGQRWLRGVTDSDARNLIAAIPETPEDPANDRRFVLLFDSTYLNPAGRLTVPNTPGNWPTRGRWVFFNAASTAVYVVSEALIWPSQTPNNYVHTISLQPPTDCGASFSVNTANAVAAGLLGRVDIDTSSDCRYLVTSDVPWLEVLDDGPRSGRQTLSYAVRQNTSPESRTGRLSLLGSTLTVTQEAAGPLQPVRRVGYRVIAAEYSRSLDRLVLATDTPREVHIYHPATGTDRAVPLARPPRSIAVSTDGFYALVGHDGFISLVDLAAAAVQRVYPVNALVSQLQLGKGGFGYFTVAPQNGWSLRLSDGTLTKFAVFVDNRLRLSPDGDYLYTLGSLFSPLLQKWDVRHGLPVLVPGNPWSICYDAWFYRDREYALSSCAALMDVTGFPATRPRVVAQVPGAEVLVWADHSPLRRSAVVIPSSEFGTLFRIDVYDDALAVRSGSFSSLGMSFPEGTYALVAESVFWDRAETAIAAVLRAWDYGANPSPYGIFVASAVAPPAGCTVAPQRLSLNPPFAGGVDFLSVVSGSNCPWIASSSAPWVTVTSGGFGVGSANVALSFAPNATGASRSATLAVSGATVTITQPAVACTLGLSAATFSSGAGDSSGSVTVTAPPGCGWTASSAVPWITISAGAVGTGNGGVSFSIAPNTGTAFRTGTLTIAGLPFTVTQARAGAPDPVFQDVLPSHPFYESIGQLHANGITAGCSVTPPLFCPDSTVTRAQMAVLIVTALNRRLRIPLTYPASPYFEDVRPPSPYFPFVQRIRELGITAGCSTVPPLFCGEASITHGQMAVFIIAAWMQANNLTSFTWPATPYFTDVPATHPFFRFIQKMRELGFWSGCSANQYCDTSPVTRGQMSPMIVKGILGAP